MVNLSVMIISDKWLILWYFNFENVQISIIKILLFYFFYGLLCVKFDVLMMISVGYLLKLLLFQFKATKCCLCTEVLLPDTCHLQSVKYPITR